MRSFLGKLWNSGKGGKSVIIIGTILLLGMCANIVNGPNKQITPTPVSNVSASDSTVTGTPKPANTPSPTAKPEPTQIPSPTPKTVGSIGERIEKEGIALTVVSIEKTDQVSRYNTAKDGNTLVVTEVIIENTGRDSAPYNLLYFELKDGEGFEYDAEIVVNTDTPTIDSGDLVQGDKVRGIVVFEVKKEATGLVLAYEPIVIAGGYEPIRIALDQ